MKKKWFMLGSAVGISSIVMVATGITAMAGTSGYDAYKSALKNSKQTGNVTVHAEALLQDNGNVLTDASGSVKLNLQNRTASGNVNVTGNGAAQSLSFYKQAQATVLKPGDSDVYYVRQQSDKKWKPSEKPDNPQMSQQIETVIDALVGNLKDYVSENANADGTKEISVQLDNTQIPSVVNAIAPIIIKQAASEHEHGNKGENENDNQSGKNRKDDPVKEELFQPKLPQLSQDIQIGKIALKADVNAQNYIVHQEADISVSGKDAAGTAHEVTLHLNADFSDYNSTAPDTIDLTGKQVQQMKSEHDKRDHEDR